MFLPLAIDLPTALFRQCHRSEQFLDRWVHAVQQQIDAGPGIMRSDVDTHLPERMIAHVTKIGPDGLLLLRFDAPDCRAESRDHLPRHAGHRIGSAGGMRAGV